MNEYNKELNCLPNKLEILQLPEKYILPIKKIPRGLKKIICDKNYPFINDFTGIEIEAY